MQKQERLLCVFAASAGFIMMAFELAAARMLAPAVGGSTYVWTSVIGVIIAALSYGYWVGGHVADIRHRHADVGYLFLAAALAMSATLLMQKPIIGAVLSFAIDIRLQAVLIAVVLFAPVSIMLGMISPYIAKLNVTSLKTAGRSVANLGALNSVGGIAGTFVAGFILFGYFGITQVVGMLVFFAIVISWLAAPKLRTKQRAALSAAILCAVAFALVPDKTLTIDTPSAHYVVIKEQTEQGQLVSLLTGPRGTQSGALSTQPTQLLFWYTQQMAMATAANKHDNILILGGGAYTLPQSLAQSYPTSIIDVAEIDPRLITIAREHFFYTDPPNVTNYPEDARTFLNRNTKQYDIVLVDAFGGDAAPTTMMTAEYGALIKKAAGSSGVVVVNSIAGLHDAACRPLFNAVMAPYATHFANGYYLAHNPANRSTNIMGVFSQKQPVLMGYTPMPNLTGERYTDNFIPAERLYSACRETV